MYLPTTPLQRLLTEPAHLPFTDQPFPRRVCRSISRKARLNKRSLGVTRIFEDMFFSGPCLAAFVIWKFSTKSAWTPCGANPRLRLKPVNRLQLLQNVFSVLDMPVPKRNQNILVALDPPFQQLQLPARERASMTPTSGRTATVMKLPGIALRLRDTLTRTSCRALPRGKIHTTKGRPVFFGDRFDMLNRSI